MLRNNQSDLPAMFKDFRLINYSKHLKFFFSPRSLYFNHQPLTLGSTTAYSKSASIFIKIKIQALNNTEPITTG